MKAVFLSRPLAATQQRHTGDVAVVLQFLKSWGPIADLSLFQLSHRTSALLLILSCRRISDLKLSGWGEPWCVISKNSIVLQCGFGLKQARPNHRSPLLRFSQAPDEELCSVRHVREYLVCTEQLSSSAAFFLTTVPPHRPAARII